VCLCVCVCVCAPPVETAPYSRVSIRLLCQFGGHAHAPARAGGRAVAGQS